MKSTKILNVMLLPFLLFAQISCNNDNDSNSPCEDVFCTLDFRTIIVIVKDQNENPVALDSFQVIDLENGNDITILLSPSNFITAQQTGKYPLVNDGSIDENQEKQVQFIGFIENQEVVRNNYVVNKDCCHINLTSGNNELSLL
jgi:hypothetical protein